jgi:hypothetical protein
MMHSKGDIPIPDGSKLASNKISLKEPGNIRIQRTRVIHLYEAD